MNWYLCDHGRTTRLCITIMPFLSLFKPQSCLTIWFCVANALLAFSDMVSFYYDVLYLLLEVEQQFELRWTYISTATPSRILWKQLTMTRHWGHQPASGQIRLSRMGMIIRKGTVWRLIHIGYAVGRRHSCVSTSGVTSQAYSTRVYIRPLELA